MKPYLAGVIDRGNGSTQPNQKSGPPAAYNSTDIAGGVIYVLWSDLQPADTGTLAGSRAQALTGTGSGWTATGINLIDFALAEALAGHRQDGSTGAGTWQVVIRPSAGVYSPAWTYKPAYGGSSFTYIDKNSGVGGTCPAWWRPMYQTSYNALMALIAARYDDSTGNHAVANAVSIAGCMTVYQESMLRGMNDQSNIEGMVSAGYYLGGGDFNTSGSDRWAQLQTLIAHQAFVNTWSDIALNPYQYLYCGQSVSSQSYRGTTNWRNVYSGATAYTGVNDAPTNPDSVASLAAGAGTAYVCIQSNTGKALTNTQYWQPIKSVSGNGDSLNFDTTMMDQVRLVLPCNGIIGNNSLGNTGNTANNFVHDGTAMNDMYYDLWQRSCAILGTVAPPTGGSGFKIQTCTTGRMWKPGGGTGSYASPLGAALDTCTAHGVGWVEAPGGYDQTNNSDHCYLPPAGSTGPYAAHTAAFYTSLLQANAAPAGTCSGGGGGGTGNLPINGEIPANTTGPGGTVG